MPIAHRSEFWLNSTQPCAILFISDPDIPAGDAVDEVMDAYGLTPSERRLLSELIAGRSLSEAAEILNIKRVTSRNRLARIMAKTATHTGRAS
jgi:DNA-binding CsgD family transcriptional regulator